MKGDLERHTVKCPHCGGAVLDHFTKCPHCGGELESRYYSSDTEKTKSIKRTLWIIAVPVVIILVALILLFR